MTATAGSPDLVTPAGPTRSPSWPGYAAAGVLTIYGTVQVVGVALAALGLVATTAPDSVLLWRLLLWEPWFWSGACCSGSRRETPASGRA